MTEANTLAGIDSGLVDDVVLGAMAMLIEDAPCEVSAAHPTLHDDITVAVYCDLDQQSAVVLRCSRPLAQRLTETMLELEPDDVQPADMLDATGEIVNIIAGNLRGLVASPGAMTAPFSVDRQAYERFDQAASNAYAFAGHPMQVLRV